jgi:hypothetical protein
MAEEPLPLVKSTAEMDVETFLKHINARHLPLGGMTVVGRSNIPGDEDESLLRAYHDKIHEVEDLYADQPRSKYSNEKPLNHRHRPAPQEAPE